MCYDIHNFTKSQSSILELLHKNFDQVPGVVVGFPILALITETLGNGLLYCMVKYERFGMDPKKRNVTNQLLSWICISLIGINLFILPIWTLAQAIGEIRKKYNLKKE